MNFKMTKENVLLSSQAHLRTNSWNITASFKEVAMYFAYKAINQFPEYKFIRLVLVHIGS